MRSLTQLASPGRRSAKSLRHGARMPHFAFLQRLAGGLGIRRVPLGEADPWLASRRRRSTGRSSLCCLTRRDWFARLQRSPYFAEHFERERTGRIVLVLAATRRVKSCLAPPAPTPLTATWPPSCAPLRPSMRDALWQSWAKRLPSAWARKPSGSAWPGWAWHGCTCADSDPKYYGYRPCALGDLNRPSVLAARLAVPRLPFLFPAALGKSFDERNGAVWGVQAA